MVWPVKLESGHPRLIKMPVRNILVNFHLLSIEGKNLIPADVSKNVIESHDPAKVVPPDIIP